jgi:threonine aldolase
MYTKATASQPNGDLSTSNDHETVSHWFSPNGTTPSSFDFRSDVVTTPTTSMLAAIQACTLLDDVFLEDPTTSDLESFIADLTGKEAAMLVMSGTMGNQVALRTHLGGPPHSIVCDQRAHIVQHEAGGAASLSGALLIAVKPSNGVYLTLEDIKEYAVTDDDVHSCPTKIISLENTLGGAILPLSEAQKISEFAKEHGIIMHLDGARLWEAIAAGQAGNPAAGSLKDYCSIFSSISLCFSKGLGAPIGSILVGPAPFIKRARWIRKMIGGGTRQAGVISSAARVSVEETFLGGKLAQSHINAQKVAANWQALGGELAMPVETNMVWLDLKAAGCTEDEFIERASVRGVRAMGGRLVVHYQVTEEAIERLRGVMEDVLRGRKGEK